MPELPEVEITKRKLEPLLLGKRVLDLGNAKILKIERRGKAILIYLGPSHLLAFHQRMTGKLLLVDKITDEKYIRKKFKLSDGKFLVFYDVRKLGVVWYGTPKKILSDNYFKTLGPDALEIPFQEFKKVLAGGHIKSFLLNQKRIAGIGNIMADEILWHAKINPERKIKKLSEAEIKRLFRSIKLILNRSIKLGGSSMRDWLQPDNSKGGYFEKRFIYSREGERCKRCDSKILRKKIAGRSSYYCAKCQKN